MIERMTAKRKCWARNYKNREPDDPSQSKDWTRRPNQSAKLADLMDEVAASTASATLWPPETSGGCGLPSEMLQDRLDGARQQVDAHEKCCRNKASNMSIIINQNEDDDHESATSTLPASSGGQNYQDSGGKKLSAATSDTRRATQRSHRTKHRRQLDKHHPNRGARHHPHHHCQTISSSDQNETSPAMMRQVKKLTRRRSHADKSVCGHQPVAAGRAKRRPLVALAAAFCLALSCALIGLCDCDSESERARLPPHHSQQRTLRRIDGSGMGNTVAPSRRVDLPSNQPAKTDRPKQELLSSMAEDIERQHWGLSSRPKVHSLASTSGHDFLAQIVASHEAAKGRPHAQPPVGINKSPVTTTTSKAELDLSRIMMMHEASAASGGTTNKRQVVSGQLTGDHKVSSPSKTTRWLAAGGDHSPLKLLSKPTGGGNILTSVMGSLLPAFSPPSQGGGDDMVAHNNSTTSTNPFTPRANAKNYLMGPLLGLGQMLMLQTSSSPFHHHQQPETATTSLTDQSVYSKPANSFLSFASPKKSAPGGSTAASSQKAKKLLATPGNDGDHSTNESSPEAAQTSSESDRQFSGKSKQKTPPTTTGGWIKNGANQLAQSYFQDSFRDLLTLSQLPILSGGPVSTAPSDLEPGGKKWLADKAYAQQNKNNRTQMIEDLLRYAYILGNVGVRRKRDPLKALGSSLPPSSGALALASHNTHHSATATQANRWPLRVLGALSGTFNRGGGGQSPSGKFPPRSLLSGGSLLMGPSKSGGGGIKPRGVMWDMATDPTLAVTVFHLLERASVALPLGFLLMPFVHMIRNPFPGGVNLGRILPARASHRSVDYEELVRRIDMVDKMLSRAMRPTHREASFVMGRR